jgi:allantoinase
MPAPPVAIHSKRVLLPDGMQEATLLVTDGIISAVIRGLACTEGIELVDVDDLVVMPGVIDPHVHVNEPGRTLWEGFETASRAAAAGGITMLVDMPLNASPVTTTADAFDKKTASAARRLHVDCGLWGGVVPGNLPELEPLIQKGVLGFKAFLTHSGIDEFPNVTEADLRQAMPVIAAHGLPLLVHCELETGTTPPTQTDPRSYPQYLASRPAAWEDEAIALMIRLCEEYRCRTHIVHLSSASSIEAIRKAKQKGLPLTVETAPHYLYFAAGDIPDGNPFFKCAPPIREKGNNDRLWAALEEGVIDFVATDHSPAPPDLKAAETGDLTKAWGGISSLQLSLAIVWTAAKRRGIALNELSKWLSAAPALLVGEQERRGMIAPGYRADLVIWNPGQSFRVEPQMLHHRHKATPYLGEELYGVVAQTWLYGQKIYDNGKFGLLNQGKWIKRC